MTEEQFWELMTFADMDAARAEDDQTAVSGISEVLKRASPEHIMAFEEMLAQKLYALDTTPHFSHSCGSSDGLLYQRCFAVAAGKEFYEAWLNDPTKAPDDLEWLEGLLYVAGNAWDESQETEYDFQPSVGIETGDNPLNQGWEAA